MPEPVQKPKRRGRVWQAVIGLLLVTLVLWAAWFFTSSAFREYVRGRLEAKISDATGGRAEIKTLQWNLSRMEFEATNITIHGLESADQKPFVHVDRLFARIKIISFFSRTVDLELLELNHPAVHLIFYPDGTTNQPSPKRKSSGQSPAEQLIDLAVGKLQLEDAELILNQQTIPLQFSANDVAFNTTFDHSDSHYDGTLRVGRVEAHAGGWRPLPASTELEFKLFRDHAVIQKLNLISGKSSVNATGEVKDLAHPSIDLKYRARVDIRELAAAARIHDLRMGTVDFDGKATISSQQSHTDGQLNFTDLLFDDGDIRVPGMRGQARYAVTADKMDFTSIRGSLLGGSASGQGEIRNWQDAHHQNAAMSFRVDGVQLREVAISSSTKKLPLTELHFDGETSGDVCLSWNGRFSDSQIQLALGITPPASVPAEQIPVTADLRGTFFLNSQTLQVQSLHLTTPGTRLNAQGTIGSDRAQLKADVQSRRAADFMPLIRAVRGPDATPFEMNGSAAFSGTVWGRFVAPSLAGHLEVTNFTTGNPMQPAG
ncbi:MAG TPA: AsmA family protein, partial [Terriglobales bacterium]